MKIQYACDMVNDVEQEREKLGGQRDENSRVARQISLREHNLSVVLQILEKAGGPLSRAQIAKQTGLTRATVSMLADQLLQARLLKELEPPAATKAGRPGTPLALSSDTVLGIGMEVNVDYIAVRALDFSGTTVANAAYDIDARAATPTTVLTALADLAEETLTPLTRRGAHIVGVTLALPGLVDSPAGPLRLAPTIGWEDVDVEAVLAAHPFFNSLHVRLGNEANLAAVAEVNAREEQDFVYVSGEIGIGGALVFNGEVFGGQHGWSSEIGHITVDPHGELCACGARGCLQQVAGQEAILSDAQLPVNSTITDLLTRLSEADLYVNELPSHEVRAAQKSVEKAGYAFGVALSNVINLFDVTDVVIGGAHSPILPWLTPHINAELLQRTLTVNWASPRVLPPVVTDGAALSGAALTSLSDVKENPASWLKTLTSAESMR